MPAGKHVFCEKPLAHSCAQAREIREFVSDCPSSPPRSARRAARTDTFRRSMEVIQAGVLGQIREVHVWMNRGCPPSRSYDTHAEPIPQELNWDFWCGPSKVLPFKNHYLGFCLHWGPWLEFGDGHLADMGAHGLNLPWRALKLGAPVQLLDQGPRAGQGQLSLGHGQFRWEFAARHLPAVKLWWHDGGKGCPPKELGKELLSTYRKVPGNGVLFAGRRASSAPTAGAWAASSSSTARPSAAACRTTRPASRCPSPCRACPASSTRRMDRRPARAGRRPSRASTAAIVAEIAMVGMLAMRLQPELNTFSTIQWDSEALKVPGEPAADAIRSPADAAEVAVSYRPLE